jgi:hypothetical protein
MLWFAAHAMAVSIWALIYWGSMKLLDRYNPRNTFGKALLVATVYTLTFMFPLPGMMMAVAWLLLLTRITMWQYDFDLVPSLIATAATVLVPYFGAPYLVTFIGDSELRAYLLLYALPGVTFGVYLASRIKHRNAEPKPQWADKKRAPVIPEARVAALVTPVAAPLAAPPRYDANAPIGDKPSLLT